MQILGLLGVNFDAAAGGICQEDFTFIQIGSGHSVLKTFGKGCLFMK